MRRPVHDDCHPVLDNGRSSVYNAVLRAIFFVIAYYQISQVPRCILNLILVNSSHITPPMPLSFPKEYLPILHSRPCIQP